MRYSRLVAGIVLVISAKLVAQDLGTNSAFVEVSAERPRYFTQETVHVRVLLGVEQQFLKTNLIQPFRQPLDVPVRLDAPWLDALDDAIVLEATADDDDSQRSLVLNDRRATAARIDDRVIDGRTFTVLEFRRAYLPEVAGELVFTAPTVEFTYATRFREDFLGSRTPTDRRDASAHGADLSLTIAPIPEDGRPDGFAGAVGSYRVRAEADATELQVGQSFKLTVFLEGSGNLAYVEPPRLDELVGFHLRGRIDRTTPNGRVVTCDLAPLRESITAIPALEFAFFDPAPPARYRIVRTDPIPLTVRPLPAGTELDVGTPDPAANAGERSTGPGIDDIYDIRDIAARFDAQTTIGRTPLLIVLLAPWIAAIAVFSFRRARACVTRDPDAVRARRAARTFRSRIDAPDAEPSVVFAEYLAARLRCPVAKVVAPELSDHLEHAGVPLELAHRAAALLDDTVAARFGGRSPHAAAAQARRLADELEPVFSSREAM